jgi:hypothetical protein
MQFDVSIRSNRGGVQRRLTTLERTQGRQQPMALPQLLTCKHF